MVSFVEILHDGVSHFQKRLYHWRKLGPRTKRMRVWHLSQASLYPFLFLNTPLLMDEL